MDSPISITALHPYGRRRRIRRIGVIVCCVVFTWQIYSFKSVTQCFVEFLTKKVLCEEIVDEVVSDQQNLTIALIRIAPILKIPRKHSCFGTITVFRSKRLTKQALHPFQTKSRPKLGRDFVCTLMWRIPDSNRWPLACQASALAN